MFFAKVSALLGCSALAFAQIDPIVEAARYYRQAHEREIVASFMEFLAIPNVAADPIDLRRNAGIIIKALQKRGVKTELLEHESAPPVVYGELSTAGATKTVLFYVHYDGSPLNAKDWITPPFQPVLRSGPIERDGQVIPLPDPRTRSIPSGEFTHARPVMIKRHSSRYSPLSMLLKPLAGYLQSM